MRIPSFTNLCIRLNRWLWRHIPHRLTSTPPIRWYGSVLHELVCRHANRRQFIGTFFFRNRPMLDLICRIAKCAPTGSQLSIAVLGCSIGAETYSIVLAVRSARPDLDVRVIAVDISPEVLRVAMEGVYSDQIAGLVMQSIFERMTEIEFAQMFEGNRCAATVRPWIREGISWHQRDAQDPNLRRDFGPQHIVIANNFLCHMEPAQAEGCLQNIAKLVRPGGHLFVTGVDLDVRAKIACANCWRPVTELIEEIHNGDECVLRDWPCEWWGLEPINKKKQDWQMRYAAVFRVNESG